MSLVTLEETLFENAKKMPDKIAIIVGDNRLSYGKLKQNIINAFLVFENRGDIFPNDCIILAADKQIEFVFIYFGAHFAGLRVVPIDSAISEERLNFISKVVNAKLIVGLSQLKTDVSTLSLSTFSFCESSLGSEEVVVDFPLIDSVADILFSTGTTGIPKGVPLTFKNISAAVRNINIFIQNTPDDIEVLALPLSHSFGLGRLRCVLAKGGTLVLVNGFTNVKKFFRVMKNEKITGFSMVPASWRYLKKFGGTYLKNFSNQIKYIEMGSAFFSPDEKKELADLLPKTRICMHYGLTEASRSTFLEFHEDAKHLSSVGKASPFSNIEIYNERNQKVNDEQEGEICIKGEHVMLGYINLDNNNKFYGDYFRTDDWGYKTKDGYVYLVSRKSELINVGGKKVSPIEIEEQLKTIKGVADCVCVGVADPNKILGEVVKAFIVKDLEKDVSFDEIKTKLVGKLEGYKLPLLYEWIDEIPKTHNGKIKRMMLSDRD